MLMNNGKVMDEKMENKKEFFGYNFVIDEVKKLEKQWKDDKNFKGCFEMLTKRIIGPVERNKD